ncbi:hypothetical protein [Mycobacterium sp. ACS1612]|nr:hypothetical protein [Mycobacterium sp. ACS1612]
MVTLDRLERTENHAVLDEVLLGVGARTVKEAVRWAAVDPD